MSDEERGYSFSTRLDGISGKVTSEPRMCVGPPDAAKQREPVPAIPVVRTSDLRFNAEREGKRAGEGGTPRPTIAPFSVARSLTRM